MRASAVEEAWRAEQEKEQSLEWGVAYSQCPRVSDPQIRGNASVSISPASL